ncbi:MAG TPA: hypothetical protein VM243_14005 [Phycisphaerae bacterium]|nr:hypothetical protein [Phycisphaerae bacterium]
MAKRNKKQPKTRATVRVQKKATHRALRPGYIQWSFQIFDNMKWGSETAANTPFRAVAEKLGHYETMPWSTIEQNRWRDHPVQRDKLIREAQKRLVELGQDDIDELWRFRLNAKQRLWGIRVDDMFRALWWDPEHLICPSKKSHT